MNVSLSSLLVIFYFLCATVLAIYGVNCHVMVALFQRARKRPSGADAPLSPFSAALPVVTTQLPIFNEYNVVERLLDAVAAFEYPAGKHHIQVLDDSTDETRELIAAKVALLQQQGVDIEHRTRSVRTGFKAGALKEALPHAKGEFVAIFDADFVPPTDFLRKSIPPFLADPQLGLAQARWEHLNREHSLLTRLQAVGIDGHFMVEQTARDAGGLFMNFNGTAGVFRKQAILDAGNWQADTLTEDLDLSYRMQLAGWGRCFLPELAAPAELPGDMLAFKNQQFRWAKGSIQTAKKLLPRILRSRCGWFKKLQAVLHMTHYLTHFLMLLLAALALPILLLSDFSGPPTLFFALAALLLFSCSGPSRMYFVAEKALGRSPLQTLALLPWMFCLGCGLAVNNSRAVIEGLTGRRSDFIRTPKQGFMHHVRYAQQTTISPYLELLAGLWCVAGLYEYMAGGRLLVSPFLLLYSMGFLSVGFFSLRQAERWRMARSRNKP